MELQLVSKEIALELKELGFDWKCRSYYENDSLQYHEEGDNSYWNYNEYISNIYSAPTHALAVKWLRDVHKINVIIEPFEEEYGWRIRVSSSPASKGGVEVTYEQAEEAGIIEAIGILKTK